MTSCQELLQTMIGFETVNYLTSRPTHPERELAIFLEGLAQSWGLKTKRLPVHGERFNLFISCKSNFHNDWLLFDSHLDTVTTEGMTIPPLDGRCEEGKIFGRGACDTKGSGAAMLWALKNYAQSPVRHFHIGLLFSVDEELGMAGAQAFTRNELVELTAASHVRGIIVGEPTRLRPVTSHGGCVRGKIMTRGRAAHSSDPSQGVSAIYRMAKVIQEFEDHYAKSLSAKHPLTGRAAASINIIHGGSQVNMIPDRCEVEFDRRLVPGESVSDVSLEISEFFAPIFKEFEDGDKEGALIEETFAAPPLNAVKNEDFIHFVLTGLRSLGLDDELTGAPWATNASHFSNLIPAVVMGPGDIKQAHTKDEWIAVAELNLAVRLYLELMLQKNS
jgi:acetylornithine deacetylase